MSELNIKSVYKYTLNVKDIQILKLPKGSVILNAIQHNDDIVIYALVNINIKQEEQYSFMVNCTGQNIDRYTGIYKYLNTVVVNNCVLHVFYCKI